MLTIDQNVFNENLLLTQAYCELQLKNTDKDVASVLRSFNQVYNGREIFTYKVKRGLMMRWDPDPLDGANSKLYDELFEAQLKNKREVTGEITNDTKFEGRILIADIDQSIPDGASEDESEGFIDMNDCPPIDTWFYMVHSPNTRILYAWIPQQLVRLVQDGIDTNMLDIFYWQDDYDDSRYSNNVNPAISIITPDKNAGLNLFGERLKNMFSK